jgi:hypothetical protein
VVALGVRVLSGRRKTDVDGGLERLHRNPESEVDEDLPVG